MEDRIAYRGLTFDDVLLEPAYSEVLPSEVDVSSPLDAEHSAECADYQQPHGYRHGKRNGDRHGPGGGPGRDP